MKNLILVALAVLTIVGTSILVGTFIKNQDDQSVIKNKTSTTLYDEAKHESNIREILASPETVEVGSRAVIPDWEWVEITNNSFVEDCIIGFGGIVTVKEVYEENLLVEYVAPDNPVSTSCPSGVQFILSKSDFVSMNGRYVMERDAIQSEKELVEKLLAQNFYGETMDIASWRWVDVVNIDSVVHNFSNGHSYLAYGKCGIGPFSYVNSKTIEGGTIQVRGEANGKVLYEYTAYGNPTGTACQSGILFFD